LRHNPTFPSNKKGEKKTQQSMITENQTFDFQTFQANAIEKLKAGQPLVGEKGILTPLLLLSLSTI
jgi:hypothetical protein